MLNPGNVTPAFREDSRPTLHLHLPAEAEMWREEGLSGACSHSPFHVYLVSQRRHPWHPWHPWEKGWVPREDGDSISTTVGGVKWGLESL